MTMRETRRFFGSDGGDPPLSTTFLPPKRVIHDFIHGVIHVQIG
ncbi:MAG TPA: hypothetical protein VFW17_16870 [Ktedonobacterales bacterium]|nr:hypothetical protein [Ktedonobacterales bacterium]